MTRPRITVVGSCNTDITVFADRLPGPGETVMARRLLPGPGGKGVNQAVAAARAGARAAMIGAVGDDAHGSAIRASLQEAGVDVSGLRTAAGPTGSAHITVDAAGSNTIVTHPGANAGMTSLTAADRLVISGSDALLLQFELPMGVIIDAAAAARRAGVAVMLTPAPVAPLPAALSGLLDLLVANEGEAQQLARAAGGEDPLETLLGLAPGAVVTLGAAGCRYGHRDGTRLAVGAPDVPVIDTTAAGDTFAGALAVALAEGRPMPAALGWATSAAALSVQCAGAAVSMPARDRIDQFARTLADPGRP